MRESRNGLRPVSIKSRTDNYKKVEGYLVTTHLEGDMENGLELMAMIELEDGGVTQYSAYDIEFDDIEEEIKWMKLSMR